MSFEQDPRWAAAHEEYLEPQGENPTDDFIKRLRASDKMLKIEEEYA